VEIGSNLAESSKEGHGSKRRSFSNNDDSDDDNGDNDLVPNLLNFSEHNKKDFLR
jgi:hypothetical protein